MNEPKPLGPREARLVDLTVGLFLVLLFAAGCAVA